MASFSLPVISQASRHALLAIKVRRALQKSEHSQLVLQERAVLRRGSEFVNEILEGSLLIERSDGQGDLTPSGRGLRAFGYALSAAHELNMLALDEQATPVFLEFRDALVAAATDPSTLEADRRKDLSEFFGALSEMFLRDVGPAPRSSEPFPALLDSH